LDLVKILGELNW